MSVLQQTNGSTVTKAAFPSTPVTVTDPHVTVTADVWESFQWAGETGATGKRLAFHNGQIVRQSEIDAYYAAATVAGVAPATGGIAGGTNVVVTGTNLRGVSGVTFGGTAATNVTVVDETHLSCTTPAHAAGAVAVVVADDAGNATLASGFTYA